MSLGLFSRFPSKVSTTVSTPVPSRFIRETRRPVCSQKAIRPSASNVWPLASSVFSRTSWSVPSGAIRSAPRPVLEQERAVREPERPLGGLEAVGQ